MGKLLVGVVHLPPLLSSARASGGFEAILAHALRDAEALRDGGADGAIVENFGDAPFCKGTRDDPVAPDVPAALAIVAREVRLRTGLPVGINCLRNDGVAALAAAAVSGATWVRVNVLTGAYVTDQGVIEGEAARLGAYRRRLGAKVAIVADLFVKHAAPLGAIPPEVAALDLAQRSGAEALVLSGDRTGLPVDAALLRKVKGTVGTFPVWLGSGLAPQNAAELWPLCDGAIVGTAIKRGGIVTEAVDAGRVAALKALLRG